MSYKRSYLIALITLISSVVAWSGVGAQSIFLQPNVKYITTGVGTEFDLELRVDASITSIKSFVYHVDFDPTKLDTVSVTQGPLLPSSGATTAFGKYIVNDTILQLEDLILGAGVAVSGPGLLATVRFRVLDTGTVVLPVVNHRVRDVNGTLLSTQAYGSAIYVNVPPQQFNLLSPIGGQIVNGLPGAQISLSWQASSSVYPGESITYTLQYGTSPTFDASATTTITGLTTNSYNISIGYPPAWIEGHYYWKVTARGTVNGYVRSSTPASEDFIFSYTIVLPTPFNLLTPIGGQIVNGLPGDQIGLSWQASSTVYPGESVTYTLQYSTSATFETGATTTVAGLTSNSYNIAVSSLTAGYEGPYYWRVTARCTVMGYQRSCTPAFENFVFSYTHVSPEPFNLLSPIGGQSVTGMPGDDVTFSWQTTTSRYPLEQVSYKLEYSTSNTFPVSGTDIIQGLTTSSYSVDVGDLEWGYEGNYYWRVTAIGSINGLEQVGVPSIGDFTFAYEHLPPEPFDLLAPANGSTHGIGSVVLFDWQDATSLIPADNVTYMFVISSDQNIMTDTLLSSSVSVSEAHVLLATGEPGLPRNQPLYWRVTAQNKYGMTRPSSSIFTFTIPGPPEPFNLISPIGGQAVIGMPGDDVVFSWQATTSRFPLEQVRYRLEYGTSNTFPVSGTETVDGLITNSYSVDVDDLEWGYEGNYYWRVTAIGNTNGLERVGAPSVGNFAFAYEHIPPEPFDLLSPANASTHSNGSFTLFNWQDAASQIPADNVTYIFVISSDPTIQTNLLRMTHVSTSQAYVSLVAGSPPNFPLNQPLYWGVLAQNKYGVTRPSSSIFSFTISGCCEGRVGDSNGEGDYPDEITLGDIMLLVDVKFISGDCSKLTCIPEADVNQDGGSNPNCDDHVTLGDIMVLVDFLFITGPQNATLKDCL